MRRRGWGGWLPRISLWSCSCAWVCPARPAKHHPIRTRATHYFMWTNAHLAMHNGARGAQEEAEGRADHGEAAAEDDDECTSGPSSSAAAAADGGAAGAAASTADSRQPGSAPAAGAASNGDAAGAAQAGAGGPSASGTDPGPVPPPPQQQEQACTAMQGQQPQPRPSRGERAFTLPGLTKQVRTATGACAHACSCLCVYASAHACVCLPVSSTISDKWMGPEDQSNFLPLFPVLLDSCFSHLCHQNFSCFIHALLFCTCMTCVCTHHLREHQKLSFIMSLVVDKRGCIVDEFVHVDKVAC